MKVLNAPKVSRKCWMNGAATSAFVYSNKGNFIIKGFSGDVHAELEKFRTKGYKFICNFVIFSNGMHRNYWKHYNKWIYINTPDKRCNKFKFVGFTPKRKEKLFKRLPKRWVDDFDL